MRMITRIRHHQELLRQLINGLHYDMQQSGCDDEHLTQAIVGLVQVELDLTKSINKRQMDAEKIRVSGVPYLVDAPK